MSVLGTGLLIFVVSWFGDDTLQAGFAYLGAWFLLFGGARPVVELQRLRYRHRAPDSDADQLARLTRIPGISWVLLFGTVALVALFLGGELMAPATSSITIPIPHFSGTSSTP
jgi:hypothetical protein